MARSREYDIPEFTDSLNHRLQTHLNKSIKMGRQDGRNAEKTIPITRMSGIKNQFQDLTNELKKYADEVLLPNLGKHKECQFEIDEITNLTKAQKDNQVKVIEESKVIDLDSLSKKHRSTIANIGDRLTNIENEFEKIEKEFVESKTAVKKYSLDNLIDKRWALFFIFILTFLEIPFTYSAFLILKTNPAVSLTIAIVLSIILAFSAHFVGASLKTKKYTLVSIVSILISLASIQVTSHFRTLHSNGKTLDAASIFSPEDIFFLIIGVSIYVICTLISFFAHSSNDQAAKQHQQHKAMKGRHKKEKKRLAEEKQSLIKQRASIDNEFRDEEKDIIKNSNNEVQELKKEKNKATNRMNAVATEYNIALGYFQSIEKKINDNYAQALSHYKAEYIKEYTAHYKATYKQAELDQFINDVFKAPKLLDMPINQINNL